MRIYLMELFLSLNTLTVMKFAHRYNFCSRMGMSSITVVGLSCLMTLISCNKSQDDLKSGNVHSDEGDSKGQISDRRSHSSKNETISSELLIEQIRSAQSSGESLTSFLDQIKTLDDASLRSLLEEIGSTKNSPRNSALFAEAAGELAERDPVSALGLFIPESMTSQEVGWVNVAMVLAKNDPDLLEKWMKSELGNATPMARANCLVAGIEVLTNEQNPERALQFYSSLGGEPGFLASDVVNAIFWKYAKESPQAAEAAARVAFKGVYLDMALREVARGAAVSDPILGLEIAAKIEIAQRRDQCIAFVYRDWMETDKEAAVSSLGQLDGAALAGILREGAGEGGIVDNLAQFEPQALLTLLGSVVTTTSNQPIFDQAVQRLAARNPEQVLDLIEGFPESDMKKRLYGRYYSVTAKENSEEARKSASMILDESVRAIAYREIGNVMGAAGFDRTIETLKQMDAKDRGSFLSGSVPDLIRQDPTKAAEMILARQLPLEGDLLKSSLQQVGAQLSSLGQDHAKQWIDKLPEQDQPYAMEGFAREMVRSDINSLSTFLISETRRGKAWESGVRVLISDLRSSDPEAASRWQDELNKAGYK